MLATISMAKIFLYIFLVLSQISAISMIPKTEGFTNLSWTVACLGLYSLSLWCLSHIIYKGMPLSLLIPILSTIVPLASVLAGVFLFKEPASPLKLMALCASCSFVGLASLVK